MFRLLQLAPTPSEVADKEVILSSLGLESLLDTLCGLKSTPLINQILLSVLLNVVLPMNFKFKFFAVLHAQAKTIESIQLFTLLSLVLQHVFTQVRLMVTPRVLKLLGKHLPLKRFAQLLL